MTVPLVVFEERYKKLLEVALENPAPNFVITLAKSSGALSDSGASFYQTGTFMNILKVFENDDGSYNVLTYGQERCLIDVNREEHIAEKEGMLRSLYYTSVKAHPLQRGDINLERVASWDTLDTFRQYVKAYFAPEAAAQIEEALPEESMYLASFICANLHVPADSRQVLLEAQSLTDRYQLARKLMTERLHAKQKKHPHDQPN